MATKIYDTEIIYLIDGTEIYLTPLKLKYLREFMEAFKLVKSARNDEEAINHLVECARIAMKQYLPSIKTTEDLEDAVDLPTVYKIIDIAAGIKINNPDNEVKEQATESGSSWDDLDLAALESEVFLLGIWKDYEELEVSMSMPEIVSTLGSKRDLDYQEKKFLAAIQGVDLDKQNNGGSQNKWEEMKARVFSGGQSGDPNDIISYQGVKAQKAGFGVGMGISYEKL
jgi:hypothetical protein